MTWLPVACVAFVLQAGVGAIEGTVRDSAGKPIAAALVRIPDAHLQTRSDSAGRYRLAGLPPSTVMLEVRRLLYRPAMSDSLVVRAGKTTHADFVLRFESGQRAVRLRCESGQVGPGGGICIATRTIGPLERDLPPGVGIIRDRVVWDAMVRRFGTRSLVNDAAPIDWNSEMVLVESFGEGLIEVEPRPGLNRVEQRNDTLVVLFGPDSLVGQRTLFVDGWIPAKAYAIPRSDAPVRYERHSNEIPIPRPVDWSAIVAP